MSVLQLDWVGAAIKWVEKGVGPDVMEQLMGTINSHILDSSQLMLGHEVSGRITDVSTVDFIAAFHLNKLEVNNFLFVNAVCNCQYM